MLSLLRDVIKLITTSLISDYTQWQINFTAISYVCRLSLNVKKVQVGNDHEMAQSERNSHSKNRGVGKTKITLTMYLYQEYIS